MSFCGNCGTENKDTAQFCKNCGKPIKASKSNNSAKKVLPKNDSASLDFSSITSKVRQIPKKVFVCIGIAIVALIGVVAIVKNIKPTIELNDYLVIDLSGYDSYGSANVRVDWEKIENDYGSKLSLTKDGVSKYASYGGAVTSIDVLKSSISVRLEKTDELSNGDQVGYNWDISDNATTYVKCKLNYSDDSFNISGLDELEKFDAFKDLEVSFSGTAPKGKVDFSYSGEELSLFDFNCDKQGDYTLSNGDVVTFTIKDSVTDYCAEHYGKVPESLTKEYTVEGLTAYVTSSSEITEEKIANLKEKAELVFNESVVNRYGKGEEHEALTYIGNYFLTSKGESYGAYNALFLVYEFKVHNTAKTKRDGIDEFDEISTGYWYVQYRDILLDEDGSLNVDLESYKTPSETFRVSAGNDKSWFTAHNWYYSGYDNLDDLYNVLVKANGEKYNIDNNIQK